MLVARLLEGGEKVFACIAPSFPVAFAQVSPGKIVSALRRLGFAEVWEVAFGAELISREYARLSPAGNQGRAGRGEHAVPGHRLLRPEVHARAAWGPGARGLAHDRSGAGHPPQVRGGGAGRVHRPLHRQESGDQGPVRAGNRGRGAHLRGAACHVRRGGHRPRGGGARRFRRSRGVPRPVAPHLGRPAARRGFRCRHSAEQRARDGRQGPGPACAEGACGGQEQGQSARRAVLRGLHQRAEDDQRDERVRAQGDAHRPHQRAQPLSLAGRDMAESLAEFAAR